MTKTLQFTDSHCHLDFDAFSNSLPNLLDQCQQAHIHNIIIPTIGPSNWLKVIELSKRYNNKPVSLYPCLGIHPWFLDALKSDSLITLEALIVQHRKTIIAVGEAGVDGVIDKEKNNLSQQLDVFEAQLQLAEKYHLPIIIHHRRSHQHITPLLKKYQLNKAGIIHAFSGSYQQACQYIDLGFKLGVGGTITYPRAEKTIKAIKRLPLESLVLETDAPSMPLYGFQGQDNSPLQVSKVFQALVNIRSETTDYIAKVLEQNIQPLLTQ